MLQPHHCDLARPSEGLTLAGAVLLHPHPDFGGNRHNAVVQALYDTLPKAGVAALRFDFSSADPAAAAREAAGALDIAGRELPGLPLALVGYSFGAAIAAACAHERVAARVLVAPPVGMLPPALKGATAGLDGAPVLVLAPEHDLLGGPEAAAKMIAGWSRATVEPVAMADHLLTGRAGWVAERVAGWLGDVLALA